VPIRCFGMSWKLIPTLFVAALVTACSAGTGSVSGTDYAPEYDFREFYAATNGRTFRVVVAGNPFPTLARDDMRRRLLPVMQDNKPQSQLTFTYEVPIEPPHPDYRMVLVFDAANDLTAASVCTGQIRLQPTPTGLFNLFAVYCRNDLALSQTATRTPASGPEDPRVAQAFKQVFLELFNPFVRLRRPPLIFRP
jgi:hypothetical protein